MRHTALVTAVLIVASCTGGNGSATPPAQTGAQGSSPSELPTRSVIPGTDVDAVAASPTRSPVRSPQPLGRYRMPAPGLFTYMFERRGDQFGFGPGQPFRSFGDFDPVVGTTIGQEVGRQLDAIRAMGITTLSLYLEKADEKDAFNDIVNDIDFTLPACLNHPNNGIPWPDPTPKVLSNLRLFLDLVASKGMKVQLGLVNLRMEDRANSEIWIGALLSAVKGHPGLDLVNFVGDTKIREDGNKCGQPAEPPLWYGPRSQAYDYLKWVFGYAMARGVPARQLTTEAIIGSYFWDTEPRNGNPAYADRHAWRPIRVLKMLYDDLGIPDSERVYGLSWYEHTKCLFTEFTVGLRCDDLPPHEWAEQTIQDVLATIGKDTTARIVVIEMGLQETPLDPKAPTWTTERAVESLAALIEKYQLSGGSFWAWTKALFRESDTATYARPVKRRGVAFAYYAVQKELLDYAGYHLFQIPNGSFEDDPGGVPIGWTISGVGSANTYDLRQESGQPEVPTRGNYALRLTSGDGNESATSQRIAVAPSTTYTTTANLRFSWTGDPNPRGSPATRPQVFITLRYLTESGAPSTEKASDTFRYFQDDATAGFGTFPVQYQTPADARFLQVEIGAARNGLPTAITLDVDNVR